MLRASPPVLLAILTSSTFLYKQQSRPPHKGDLSIEPPPIAVDKSVTTVKATTPLSDALKKLSLVCSSLVGGCHTALAVGTKAQ